MPCCPSQMLKTLETLLCGVSGLLFSIFLSIGDLSWSRSAGLTCFPLSLWHSWAGGSSQLHRLVALGSSLHLANGLPGHITGFRPLGIHALWPSPWNCPHKDAGLSLGTEPGSEIQPGEGSRGAGRDLLIQQTAPLCWGIFLWPGWTSILLATTRPPTPQKKSDDTSVYLCIQASCPRRGELDVEWRKHLKKVGFKEFEVSRG